MPRYVAIPKAHSDPEMFSAPMATLDAATRAERIGILSSRSRADVTLGPSPAVRDYFEAKKNAGILATPRDRLPLTGVTVIEGDAEDAAILQSDLPDHEIVEDFPIHLIAPVVVGMETDGPTDFWHLGAVGLDQARSAGFAGEGQGVTVAVLDTGIAAVPELEGKIAGAWEIAGPLRITEIDTHDTDGHGTGVASLVAGRSVGIAPGAKVLNVLMIPFQNGTYIDFLSAMEFTAGRSEVAIANISAGIIEWEPRMLPGVEALLRSGILPVVAVGNEGHDTSRSPGNFTEVFSVGASNRDGEVWSGSGSDSKLNGNTIYTVPDVVAPGQEVTTCGKRGKFQAWNGSSIATPIVSGIAALIVEKHHPITLADLREEILGACTFLNGVAPLRQGEGLVKIPTGLWFAGV